MKKQLLLISAICGLLSSYAVAQSDTIPNPGFEYWHSVSTFEEPNNWHTINSTTNAFGVITATKDVSTPHSGLYAVKLESKLVPIVNYKVPGVATTGAININTSNGTYSIDGGSPYTASPDSMTGFYKFMPAAADTFSITVTLTKWNTTTSSRDLIGGGYFMDAAAQTAYTFFTVPITYNPLMTGVSPDSALIILLSDQPANATPGTQLYVDDLAFVGGNVGTKNTGSSLNKVLAYPNPAANELVISNSLASNSGNKLVIYNAIGNKTNEFSLNQNNSKIDISRYGSGIYFYQIIDSNNTILYTGKFVTNK